MVFLINFFVVIDEWVKFRGRKWFLERELNILLRRDMKGDFGERRN